MKAGAVRVMALLLVAGLVVSGGVLGVLSALRADDGSPRDDLGPAPTSTPGPSTTAAPRAALAAYYDQSLEWRACGRANECAALTVPLDYAEPDGETIQIAVLRVPAQVPDARIGSLVVNPGGPGAPGTSYAAQARQVFREPLLQRFDIVGFDPRGTGSSSPVDCLGDQELDGYIASDPDPDTAAERRALTGWVATIGQGCVERSGELAEHITTVEAARDIDILRAALGEDLLSYFGASYGTKLGATYADLFPDRVGRLVLDGAVDLGIDARKLSLGQAAGFETALRAYVADCVDAEDDCFLGDTVEDGLDRIRQFIDEVDAQPLATDSERDLEVGNAFYGIVAPLYNRDYWYVLSQALRSGFSGDGSILIRLSDLYTSRGAGGYDDNSIEALYAINCLDDPFAIAPAEVAANLPAFEKASPTFGRVFAWGLTACAGVRARASEPARRVTGAGAPPIVVVGTSRDPATPYAWAVSLAEQLESGVLVSRDGDGHTGYNAGNTCVDEAIESYLIDGEVPQDGLSC